MKAFKNIPRWLPTCHDSSETDSSDGRHENEWTVQKERFRPIHFLLSCIANCVGLGNLWRFPFTAYKHGGGAFLLPYIISLVLIGTPLYFLEVAIGQFSSRGQVKMWKLSPIFKGIGYMSTFAVACITSYYCYVLALTLYYLITSFSATLPWAVCDDNWINVTCDANGTVWQSTFDETTNTTVVNETSTASVYFEQNVVHLNTDISDGIGFPDWKLTLCLLGAWLVLFGILMKGAMSMGRAAYVTATFPYVVILIMLGQGLLLDGAWEGIKHFLVPQWGKLLELKVWYEAVVQCFFSLSVGTGCTVMLGSYNRFDHKLYRDATIIMVVDTLTSILAGCTIFAALGNSALVLNKSVADVQVGGMSLAFKTYPLILSKIGWAPQLFSVLFFLMLFTLGIGSAMGFVNCVITVIRDRKPEWRKECIAAAVCVCGFLSGLVYVTPGGETVMDLVDTHSGGFLLFFVATFEIVVIAWVYGVKNICRDLEFMLPRWKPSFYWKICWGGITPVALCILLVAQLMLFEPVEGIPKSATVCGWILTAMGVLLVPYCAVQVVVRRSEGNWLKRIVGAVKPGESWGPSQWDDRRRWVQLHIARRRGRLEMHSYGDENL